MKTSKDDQQYIWHPFTQMKTARLPIPITSAKGIELISEDGKTYWDLISSWWVNMHGHSHPKIAQAIAQQATKMEHVIFADFTHNPATQLAKQICKKLPTQLTRAFFSDNGSTSIEVAIKIAYQYWYNLGEKEKHKIISFQGSYHGDTFGAMSLSYSKLFYEPFEKLLFPSYKIPFPDTWENEDKNELINKETNSLELLNEYLIKNNNKVAAIIIEPCIQGAGGMKMCRHEFVSKMVTLAKKHNVLVIFDEVMTGFGRTGDFFVCNKTLSPDIVCMSKGITGGFLPLALTVTTQQIYEAFLDDDSTKCLVHGHSYTANPICCAASLASLQVFEEENTLNKISNIEKVHQTRMKDLSKHPLVSKVRVKGSIAAFDVKVTEQNKGYNSSINPWLKNEFLNLGLLIRPLGQVIYLIPPYCITEAQLNKVYDLIKFVMDKLLTQTIDKSELKIPTTIPSI